MLPLVLLGIVFFFLVVGACVFVLCAFAPPSRKYALSAALWFATWGPCTVALLMLAGLGLIANALVLSFAQAKSFNLPHLPGVVGPAYAVAGILGTFVVATTLAWLHQLLIRQMTLALFRMYATLVSTGIGSVLGWCFWFWLVVDTEVPHKFLIAIPSLLTLCVAFGCAGFRCARHLRPASTTSPGLVLKAEYEALPQL